jgi:hypothetical protein
MCTVAQMALMFVVVVFILIGQGRLLCILVGFDGGNADQLVVILLFKLLDGGGEFGVLFHRMADLQFPAVAGASQRVEIDGDIEDLGETPADGLDAQGINALEVPRDFSDKTEHFDVVGGALGEQKRGETGRPFVVAEAHAVALQSGPKMGMRDRAKESRLTGVGHGPAETAHEDDSLETHCGGNLKHMVGEFLPTKIRFPAEEEDKASLEIGLKYVEGHLQFFDKPFGVLDLGTEKGGDFHGAREVVDVERVGFDPGDFDELAIFHHAADGTGGDQSAIHPAGESRKQGAVGEGDLLEGFKMGGIHRSFVAALCASRLLPLA